MPPLDFPRFTYSILTATSSKLMQRSWTDV
jgi:hypothetical protein